MKTNNLTHRNFPMKKLFDICKLDEQWKRVDNSIPRRYVLLKDDASIDLRMIKSNFTESYNFKKNSFIIIKDSIAEFYEGDLFR
ncbi:hypothetical protein [Nitrosopumilus sp.]|uniref:hypothetical protein n=1 Tax=Nitrosopumilus sp. TaxID=2024843 RepID=UPI0034A01659